MSQDSPHPELDKLISVLSSSERQDLVVLIIPSHDKKEKPLPDQDMWANAALDLLGTLYGGATGFNSFGGVYKDKSGRILRDKPILVESYVTRSDLEDPGRLKQLLAFMTRMGRETRQSAVALVINNVFHEIKDFKAP